MVFVPNKQLPRRPRGTGSIIRIPDSPYLWIKYSKNGKPCRESAKTTDRKKAQKLLQQRLAEISIGTFIDPKSAKIKVSELAEDFLRDYRINDRKSIDDVQARWSLHLEPFFGHLQAAYVSSTQINQYVDQRLKEKAAPGTINRELAALKRMFNLGYRATPPKVIRPPVFQMLKEENIRQGFLADGKAEKIVEYHPILWFRSLVECGRTYGWRVTELLNLKVEQIDLANRVIRLEPGTTKNKEGREVIMTKDIFHLLSSCVEGKKSQDFVFTRPNGKPILDFRKLWNSACKHAGCTGLLFHDLRRTGARNLRRAGVAEGVIMKIGGWKTRSVFERYNIVDNRDIADGIRKLEANEKQINEALAEQSASALKPN